jgi:anti-sigma factor RsiW
MTQHIADNHEALLAYLYEEGDPAERLDVARHLQECAPCSVAVLEFQNVRGMLHDWTPPATELGFRIVQEKQAVPVPPRAFSFWPPAYGGWARAAAAVLVFAAGMAVSQFTMSYDAGMLIVRLRQSDTEPAQSPNARDIELAAENGPGVTTVPERPLDNRLTPAATATDTSTEQLLQRVRSMIDQSEQRQQRELALRLSQLNSEVDAQHQADLLRIQQNFGQQQEDVMNYLVRTGGAK